MKTTRLLALGIWLVILWMMLWDELAAGTAVGGSVVAAIVLKVFSRGVEGPTARPDAEHRARVSVPGMVRYVVYVLVQIVKSNVVLAWRITTHNRPLSSGVVRVPLISNDPLTTVMAANAITLTPGTLTIETAPERQMLYVSALYVDDVEALRRELATFERYAIRAAGSRSARATLAALDSTGVSR